MRPALAALVFAVSVGNPSHLLAQDNDSILIPDGDGMFAMPQTFGADDTRFSENPTSKRMSEQFSNTFIGLGSFVENTLLPHMLNLE